MKPACRLCRNPLEESFADLGMSPISNSYVKPEQLHSMEPFYPLHAYVCGTCLLVQVAEVEQPARIFSDYAYFSSYSADWVDHARRYAEEMAQAFALNSHSLVMELASNDGYLLQFFQRLGIPVIGIEPAGNVAAVALEKGVPTRTVFFGDRTAEELAGEGLQADLLVANNVLAHVPDLHGFVAGMKRVLAADGIVTVEFPHLLELIRCRQFDTIYHEHFSYFSLAVVARLFEEHGLVVFRAGRLPTHGGSLRVFGKHAAHVRAVEASVDEVKNAERDAGLQNLDTYRRFQESVIAVKCGLLRFLIEARSDGKSVVGYGAPAKGNTMLNYCGVGPELLPFTVDLSPHKQGLFLPGTHIPILSPEAIGKAKPDYVLILPWNLREEISRQLSYIRDWGGRFVVPIPAIEVF